jgi:replicative DNA helicase
MSENKPLQVKDHFIENSQKFITYLWKKDASDHVLIKPEYILNSRLRKIYTAICNLAEQSIPIEIDILLDECRRIDSTIEYNELKLLYDSFDDFSNIDTVRKRLHQDYLKQKNLKTITGDLFVNLDSNNDLDLNKTKKLLDDLQLTILELEGEDTDLMSFEDIFIEYKQKLLERWEGKEKRSIGIPELDKHLTYAGEPGTMMTIAGQSGCGKTTIFLNSLVHNVNRNICCIYFSLDMGTTPICDRYICIKGKISNRDLFSEHASREQKGKILRYAGEYTELKNYIHYPEEKGLTLDKLDSFLYKAKQKFKQLGVLPEDEYIIIYLDTLDLVDDFSGMDPNKMEISINKLHFILRKHKCFALNALQLGENKLRSAQMTPEKVDSMHFSVEDIFGSSAFKKRNRAVIVAQRNLAMKKTLFPTHADREMWDLEEDILKLSIVKQNDGPLVSTEFTFDSETYRIVPRLKKEDFENFTNNKGE